MSSAAVGVSKFSKHGAVKKSSIWLRDCHYEWLKTDTGPGSDTVVGLFCTLCKKHSKLPRNGSATWVTFPCRSVCKDNVDRHINSSMHAAAIAAQKDLNFMEELGRQ